MRSIYQNIARSVGRVAAYPWLLIAVAGFIVYSGAPGGVSIAAKAEISADGLGPARQAISNRNWARAMELLDKTLLHGTEKVEALLLKAKIYAALGEVDKQRQTLQAAVALDDSLCEPRLILGMLEENRGLWQRAAKWYRQAIDSNPGCSAAYLQLADLYQNNNQPRQALSVLQQAVENNPSNTRLLAGLADMCEERDLLEQAETVYGQIVTVGDDSAKAEAYRRLGGIYTQVGQYADAFECYAKAAELQGGVGALDRSGYNQIFRAADGAVSDALHKAWKPFTAHIGGGPVAREEAYVAVEAAARQIQQIKQFAGQLKVPPALQPVHNQRQLFYSVSAEAAFTAQMYLDTGNKQLRDAAGQRRYQAEREGEELVALSRQ